MNKKGVADLSIWVIASLTLMLIVLATILLFVKKSANAVESSADSVSCKSSVLAHSRFGTKIDCPVEFVKVKTLDQSRAKRQVANALVKCYDSYGRGRIKLFAADDKKFCSVCSIVSFEKEKELIGGFPLFLSTSYFTRQGKRFNYYEYLSGYKTSQEVIDFHRKNPFLGAFDPKEKYVVLFTYYKKSDWTMLEMVGVGIVVGAVVVGIVAATVATGGIAGVAAAGAASAASAGASAGAIAVAGTAAAVSTAKFALASGAVLVISSAAIGGGLGAELHESGSAFIGDEHDAAVIITHLNEKDLKSLGCEELPVALTGLGGQTKNSTINIGKDG